jgi:hypothetical protein
MGGIPMESNDFALYSDKLFRSIKRRYPNLSNEEVRMAINTLMLEIGNHIVEGGDLALVRRNRDGSVDMTLLEIKVINKIRRR